MKQIYDVVLDAQLGQRVGTLVLDNTDGAISGLFFLLGFENPVKGRCVGQELELRHKLRTALSTLDCETLFDVVSSQNSRMELRGKKQEDQ